MRIESEYLGNGSARPERFAGTYRGVRRDGAVLEQMSTDDHPDGGETHPSDLDLAGPPGHPSTLPPLDLDGLTEPVFSPADWSAGPAQSLADHPLLRGLLLELPPKGTNPGSAWLDRWFEAARSILELLYVQESGDLR